MLLLKECMHLVSVDRSGIKPGHEISILRLLLIIHDHSLNLRQHALPFAVHLVFLLALLHRSHSQVTYVLTFIRIFLVA